MKCRSQNNEDEVLQRLIDELPGIPKTAFEVGASIVEGYLECNTGKLLEDGWYGTVVDRDIDLGADRYATPIGPNGRIVQHTVTAENFLNSLPPYELGVLSIDVDGIDYWLWESLPMRIAPWIVVIEYNAALNGKQVIPYDPHFRWTGSDYFGASAEAVLELAERKGYVFVAVVESVNMFFVRKGLPISTRLHYSHYDFRKHQRPYPTDNRLYRRLP